MEPGFWFPVSSFQQRSTTWKPETGNWNLRDRPRRSSALCRAAWIWRCARNRPSARSRLDFPATPSAGLSVGEPRALTREIVESTLEHLPADKPRYLMGVGTPEEIVEYANLGVDMMDCVLPTRAARHGLLFTSEGKSLDQAGALCRRIRARSTQIAAAGCAGATRGPICVIFMHPTRFWPRS